MSGTRKLEKFDVGRPGTTAFESGTRKLEAFVVAEPALAERVVDEPAVAEPASGATAGSALAIPTPVAEMSPAILAAARASLPSLPSLPEPPPPPPPPPPDEASVMIASDTSAPAEEGEGEGEGEGDEAAPMRGARASRALDREASVEKLRTRLARKFTTLADEVTSSFDDLRIGAGSWTVELTAPDGMSTAGGKRVLQHLRLRPTRQGFAVLVGGVVNAVEKTAELRDFAHMQTMYRARFGRDLEIAAAEWEQFLRMAEVVLRRAGIQTSRVAAPKDLVTVSRERAPTAVASRRTLATAALGLVGFLAAIVAWRVLLVLLH
jgi:hypothetical protein